MRNPQQFAQEVADGNINLQVVENVQACFLRVGQFYLQRPAALGGAPFELVKVVKVHMEQDGKTQMGAWVHPWEVSTTGDDVDYFVDPWHASSDHKDSQRYNPAKPMHLQGATWTYPLSALEEFQDEVPMKKRWIKPSGFTKRMRSVDRVHKRSIVTRSIPKVRNFTHRWNEDEEGVDNADDDYNGVDN
jgi:hypothetical protein